MQNFELRQLILMFEQTVTNLHQYGLTFGDARARPFTGCKALQRRFDGLVDFGRARFNEFADLATVSRKNHRQFLSAGRRRQPFAADIARHLFRYIHFRHS